MNIYEITAALQAAIDESFDEETGELLPDGEARIAALEDERNAKALALAAVVKNLKIEEDAYRGELARLRARADACERRHTWLRQYLAQWLPDGLKLKDARSSIGWGRSESVEIAEDAVLPDRYQRVKLEVDKQALKQDLKDGQTVPGAHLVTKRFVTIR
jgi:hypothetical protein